MNRRAANAVGASRGVVPVFGWANGPNLVDPHSVPGYIGAIVFGLMICLLGLALVFDYRDIAQYAQEDGRWPITLPVWCFRMIGAGIFAFGIYMGAHGIALWT
jgi:hypothetical protein